MHLQVMPEFLEFLFSFGLRSYAEDFHFSGFRHRIQHAKMPVAKGPKEAPLPERFEMCCNMKSVEPSPTDGWSIRNCAYHHSFDFKEVRATWIIIKGDELIRKRMASLTSSNGRCKVSDFASLSQAFQATLELHLFFGDWSLENWRWYVNSLEEKLQGMTRKVLVAPVNVPLSAGSEHDRYTMRSRVNTQETAGIKKSGIARAMTQLSEKLSSKVLQKGPENPPNIHINPDTGIIQQLPPEEDSDDDEEGPDRVDANADPLPPNVEEHRDFSFGKLRKVYNVAENANEALLVLRQNRIVFHQLKTFYLSLVKRKNFPESLAEECADAVDDFRIKIEGFENDTQAQILRLETLIRLLEDRKNLVKALQKNRPRQGRY